MRAAREQFLPAGRPLQQGGEVTARRLVNMAKPGHDGGPAADHGDSPVAFLPGQGGRVFAEDTFHGLGWKPYVSARPPRCQRGATRDVVSEQHTGRDLGEIREHVRAFINLSVARPTSRHDRCAAAISDTRNAPGSRSAVPRRSQSGCRPADVSADASPSVSMLPGGAARTVTPPLAASSNALCSASGPDPDGSKCLASHGMRPPGPRIVSPWWCQCRAVIAPTHHYTP